MQRDVDAGGHVVGHERRHADAEIDVVAVLQLARDALDDALSNVWHSLLCARGPTRRTCHRSLGRSRRWLATTVRSVNADRSLFDPLFVRRAADDVTHEDARRHDVVRIDPAGLDELLD